MIIRYLQGLVVLRDPNLNNVTITVGAGRATTVSQRTLSQCSAPQKPRSSDSPNSSIQHLLSQREQHLRSHNPCKPLFRPFIYVDLDPPATQPVCHVCKAEIDDLKDRSLGKFVEDEHGVKTVEEFRGKILGGAFEDFTGCLRGDNTVRVGCSWVREDVATEVACEADYGVL